MLHTSKTIRNFLSLYPCKSTSNIERSTSVIASYPGLLTPAFVACSTNVGGGMVKLFVEFSSIISLLVQLSKLLFREVKERGRRGEEGCRG